jgi:uncharacterized alkaline shock family protein YloU
MAMNSTAQGYLLPCGRDIEVAWDRLEEIEAGRGDEHEQTCPHCRAARESLRMLREVTGHLIEYPVEPSVGLTDRIMAAVRAEVRRHDMVALPSAEPGAVLISEQAAATVLRFAADSVVGVHARRCRVTATPSAEDAGAVGAVEVELSVAVSYRSFVAGELQVVRERVSAAAAAGIGVRVARLDVIVTDLYDA